MGIFFIKKKNMSLYVLENHRKPFYFLLPILIQTINFFPLFFSNIKNKNPRKPWEAFFTSHSLSLFKFLFPLLNLSHTFSSMKKKKVPLRVISQRGSK